MALERKVSGGKVSGEFKLLQPVLQLFIFADNPGNAEVEAKIQGLRESIRWLQITMQPDSFRGTGANNYRPPFNTKIEIGIPPRKDAALYQSMLEEAVNGVLAKIPGRCAVWSGSSELYKR